MNAMSNSDIFGLVLTVGWVAVVVLWLYLNSEIRRLKEERLRLQERSLELQLARIKIRKDRIRLRSTALPGDRESKEG